MSNMGSNSFLAVYGSLRRRALARRGFQVARSLSFFGHGILRGQLFVQNGYPGAVEGPGAIQVEIFRIRDQAVFQVLDFYEGFSADSRGYSLFDRKVIRLLRPGIVATVYFLARHTPRGRPAHPRTRVGRPLLPFPGWLSSRCLWRRKRQGQESLSRLLKNGV